MKKVVLTALMLCGIAGTAQAHLMFPAQVDDGYALKFWADDHWADINNDQVIGLYAYQDGKRGKAGYNFADGKIVLKDGNVPDMLTSEYDFGYYTFTADGHFPKPRNEVEGAIFDSRHIYKLGKGLYKWDDAYSKPVGMKIEVTPLSNPLTLKVGDTLKVLVTLDGKPYQGASFEDQAGDLDDVTSNADGIAELTIREPQDGFVIIGAGAKLPYTLSDNKAQTLQLTGVLAFKAAE